MTATPGRIRGVGRRAGMAGRSPRRGLRLSLAFPGARGLPSSI